MKGVLKKRPLARWSAAGIVLGRSSCLAAFRLLLPIWSTREEGRGDGDVQFIRLYSVDDVGDVAVSNYRGTAVPHVVLGRWSFTHCLARSVFGYSR